MTQSLNNQSARSSPASQPVATQPQPQYEEAGPQAEVLAVEFEEPKVDQKLIDDIYGEESHKFSDEFEESDLM